MQRLATRRRSLTVLLATLCLTIFAAAQTQANPQAKQTIQGLGTATFPTSTQSPEAQAEFMRGLLLLHTFEYVDAVKAFQSAEKLDPTLTMAYWGEAMTYNHPVWNEVDVPSAQAALKKLADTPEARAATIPDPRQRAYLAALEILYDNQGTKRERDARYATAMQALAQAYPADDEAQLFYSLALLGRSEGIRDVPTYLQAAAIAKAAYQRNPNHPGAAHYWIHGMDDPDHATGALEAARALSKIAPDASHGQHMCSHIFMALGMWDDVVEANLIATRVVNAQYQAAGLPILTCGHYVIWLQYAYDQQGRHKEAEQLLSACDTTTKDVVAWMAAHPGQHFGSSHDLHMVSTHSKNSLVTMRATSVIESLQWNGAAAVMTLDTTAIGPEAGWNDFTTGYAAAQRGDVATAQRALKKLQQATQTYRDTPTADQEMLSYLSILSNNLSGLISSKTGDMPAALTQVRQAATTYDAMAIDFGPPPIVKPPHELLGELLLKDNKPQQAAEAFQASLKRAPNRSLSLLGLARAQNATGDKAAAEATYKQLLANWKTADPGNEDVTEARNYITASTKHTASN
jgi:hypothetical protein